MGIQGTLTTIAAGVRHLPVISIQAAMCEVMDRKSFVAMLRIRQVRRARERGRGLESSVLYCGFGMAGENLG